MAKPNFLQIAASSILLRCPGCGIGKLFAGLFSMHARCPGCHLKFEREQGYFVGAIYINYAATVAIAVPGYLVLDNFTGLSLSWQLGLWIPFAIFFPLLFFRHSRSLWLGLDYFFNPDESIRRVGNISRLRR